MFSTSNHQIEWTKEKNWKKSTNKYVNLINEALILSIRMNLSSFVIPFVVHAAYYFAGSRYDLPFLPTEVFLNGNSQSQNSVRRTNPLFHQAPPRTKCKNRYEICFYCLFLLLFSFQWIHLQLNEEKIEKKNQIKIKMIQKYRLK